MATALGLAEVLDRLSGLAALERKRGGSDTEPVDRRLSAAGADHQLGLRIDLDLGFAAASVESPSHDITVERLRGSRYAVELADYDITVELTATERTGLHRYVFPPGEPAHVILDLEHRDELTEVKRHIL